MTLADARRFLDYNTWANARTWDAVAALSDAQQRAPNGSSFPSILLTLAHIVGAEWIWMERWSGRSASAFPEWVASPTSLDDLRRRLEAIDAERRTFIDAGGDAGLAAPLPYTLFSGTTDEQPFEVLLTHVMNHSTYHRGQIATMLRQLGLKPVSTDFIAFAREK